MIRLKAPQGPLKGQINLPISKSLANRQQILLFQAGLLSDFTLPHDAPNDVRILNRQLNSLAEGSQSINVGDAGTAMRFILPLCALSENIVTVSGTSRMIERPIGPLTDALKQMGAHIDFRAKTGYPPLSIRGTSLSGGRIKMSGSVSSQFISSLLLSAPSMEQDLEIELTEPIVSRPYIEMTLKVMAGFGISYEWSGNIINVPRQVIQPLRGTLESDWSAASYFFGMVAVRDKSDLLLSGLRPDSPQGDQVCRDIYLQLGVSSYVTEEGIRIVKDSPPLDFFEADCVDFPDLAQSLAFTCALLGIGCRLTGLKTLRIKETDRIEAIRQELLKIGVDCVTSDEGLQFEATNTHLPVTSFSSYDDHRMVMSESISSCVFDTVQLNGHDSVSKSFPSFFHQLERIGFEISELNP